jgi:hypothetical protein
VRLRALAALIVASAVPLGACAADAAPSDATGGFETVSTANPRILPRNPPLADGEPGPGGGTLFAPVSPPIEHAIAYRFGLGHCGLMSPIDLDGSFWDPIDGVTAGGEELDLAGDAEINHAASGAIVVIGDESRFRTDSGSIVRLERHAGDKEFPGCD